MCALNDRELILVVNGSLIATLNTSKRDELVYRARFDSRPTHFLAFPALTSQHRLVVGVAWRDSLFDFDMRDDDEHTQFAVRRKFKLHNSVLLYLHFDAESARFVLCVFTKRRAYRIAVTNDSFADARSLPKPALDANTEWRPFACVLHEGICIVNNWGIYGDDALYVYGGDAFSSIRRVKLDVFVYSMSVSRSRENANGDRLEIVFSGRNASR